MPVDFINSVTPPVSTFIIFCATTLGTITILVAVFYLAFHKTAFNHARNIKTKIQENIQELYVLFLSAVGSYVLSVLLKEYFGIARPFVQNSQLNSLITEVGYSFPSSHATVFMAIAVSLYFMHKRVGIIFLAGAIIIGLGRIFVGVHTPIDVIFGYVLGGGYAYIVGRLFRIRKQKKRST